MVEDAFGATKPSKVPFVPEVFPDIKFIGDMVCDHSDRVLYGCYPGPVQTTKSYILANQACKWIYWHNERRPFLLRVSFDDPHPPIVPPEPFFSMYNADDVSAPFLEQRDAELSGKSRTIRDYLEYTRYDRINNQDHRRHIACYLGMVSHLDAQIGRILNYMDELGLTDNTLIVLTSDQGHMLGEHGLVDKGLALYEGAIRVPLIMCWPNHVPAGLKIDALVEGIDFAPTILDILGITPQREILDAFQGRSMKPLLEGDMSLAKNYVYTQWDDYGFCIRGKQWKLIWWDPYQEGELYDLDADPLELTNLYDQPEHFQVRTELLDKLEAWRRTCGLVAEQ